MPILKAGIKALTKKAAPTVLKEALPTATKVAKPLIEESLVNSGRALDNSLKDVPFWQNTHPSTKKLIQNQVDLNPDDGRQMYERILAANADDDEAIGALVTNDTANHIKPKLTEAYENKRILQADVDGKPLPETRDPFAPTISDDLNYLEKGVDYTDELSQWEKNQAKAVSGMETAIGKGKNFSEDLLNRRTTIAQIPGQIKKWLKKASQKAKAGIPFEVGDPLYDEMGEFLGSSIEGMTFQELHHELMKAVYSAYVDTAAKLVQAGKGNNMDILNLNHMAKSYGFGMGDFGVEAYPRISHSWSHTELIKEGVQKSGDELKAQVKGITELSDMQALTQDFKRSLEELAIPMKRKMDLGKRAYMQLPEADRIKVIQLRGTKDALKTDLKELMIGEFQQAGLPVPKGDGQQIFKAFKKAGGQPSQEAIDLNKAIDLTRKEGTELSNRMKESIGPIVEKDVELDVKEMEELIDMQFEGITDADTMTREWALKMGSIREAKIKADQKLAAEAYDEPVFANRTKEEWARDLEKLKRGEISIPTTLPK
tara:strand:+ start:694 stop:2322 length:1629 start_codon:yes stop_codon:yes gene_type:complete